MSIVAGFGRAVALGSCFILLSSTGAHAVTTPGWVECGPETQVGDGGYVLMEDAYEITTVEPDEQLTVNATGPAGVLIYQAAGFTAGTCAGYAPDPIGQVTSAEPYVFEPGTYMAQALEMAPGPGAEPSMSWSVGIPTTDPADVVSDATSGLRDTLLAIAPFVLGLVAGVLAVELGWRFLRRRVAV